MSTAFRSFLAELLSSAHARDARRGRAFVVLDGALSAVLFSNPAGAKAFGIAADAVLPTVLVRQIRSSARILAERGAAALLLRIPTGRTSRPVAATATHLGDGNASVLLLVAETSETATGREPAGLLADLGLAATEAAVFAADGTLSAGTDPGENVADELASFVSDGAESRIVEEGRKAIRFWRIEDDRVLVTVERRAGARTSGEARNEPDAPFEEPRQIPAPAEAPPNRTVEPGGTAKPRGMRSIWGPPPVLDDAAAPGLPDGNGPAHDDGRTAFAEPSSRSVGETSAPAPLAAEPAFVPRFDSAPVRFVWQIDAEGRFRSFSGEFAATIGPRAADVVGRTFAAVADGFEFDENGAIRRLLDRRDTWSGRTVLWPVENTDRRVPIDLAALPTYSRDRVFDGFRGFGIIRVVDHEPDPAKRGLHLHATESEEPAPVADAPFDDAALPAEAEAAIEATPAKPVFRTFEADLPGVSFGRRETPPVPAVLESGKVVRMAPDHRRRYAEATLSEAEKAAFREIGAKLGQHQTEAKTPGALRFEREGTAEPIGEMPAGAGRELAAQAQPDAVLEVSSVPAIPKKEDTVEHAFMPDPIEGEAGAAVSPDIRTVLARLPVPAIVQGLDALVFANRAFLDFAGYDDIDSLNRAGGLDALFTERAVDHAEAHALTVRRANGEAVEASVRMQRIAFAGRSSLLMTFEQEAQPIAPAGDDAEDLRRELAELKAVLDIATDGVVLVDPNNVVRAANGSAQALFGMAEDEFRGRPVAGLFAPESHKAVADYFETLRNKGLAGIMNDGREVIGRVAQGGFVPLFITAGRVSEERGWCVVIRDMSHWKRIEEELLKAKGAAEAASLHKSRFLANISHELRTPLNAIIGFADVIASECFGPIGSERYIEYLGDIKRSGHHVLDLVNDLLDISKIEAGRMELSFETVSLNEVLTEVVSTMQPQANRQRVIVRSNLPASVPPVVADRRTIRQIALNLLSNSVRFTPAGGQVIASTTYTADGSVLLRVRDSGVGMTPAEIETALTPFQQVQRPGDVRGEGTGLGLPLTKAMAEANRASFAIRSAPGEGTLVEISFPAQRVLLD